MRTVDIVTNITFIRHGETDWNRLDKKTIAEISKMRKSEISDAKNRYSEHINQNGIKQALTVSEQLNGVFFDVVLCSKETRAVETGDIILRKCRYNSLVYDDRVGRTNISMRKSPRQSFLETRVQQAKEKLSSILDEYRGKRVLIISHGELIQLFRMFIDGININEDSIKKYPRTENCQIINVDVNVES